MTRRAVVIGGGLAGLAAAVRLADAGLEPIVLESSRRLGGRATSFEDVRSGATLDNCQHVLMGCCTSLLDFYDRIGVLDLVAWHRDVRWTADGATIDRWRPGPWPAPFHLAGSFARMRLLSFAAKRAIARACLRIARLGPSGRIAWRDRTFDRFLAETRQPEEARRRFWEPIVVSACNLATDRVAASVAMQVFQEGFMAGRFAGTMGLARVPLVELYDPARAAIEEAGGRVRLGVAARSVAWDGRRVTGVVTDAGVEEASAVVVAVPWHRVERLLGASLRDADARFRELDRLEPSPILGVHLLMPRRVCAVPHLVAVDAGIDWVFAREPDESGRQHLHCVVSAADAWMPLEESEIVARVRADLDRVLPASRGLEPVSVRAVREKRATFAATPESERLRPATAASPIGGGVSNLMLAGDWTATGWPATMEGAVRSGYAAAAAIAGIGGPVPDLPTPLLMRLLARWRVR